MWQRLKRVVICWAKGLREQGEKELRRVYFAQAIREKKGKLMPGLPSLSDQNYTRRSLNKYLLLAVIPCGCRNPNLGCRDSETE